MRVDARFRAIESIAKNRAMNARTVWPTRACSAGPVGFVHVAVCSRGVVGDASDPAGAIDAKLV